MERVGVTLPNKSAPRWLALAGAMLAETVWKTLGLTRPIPVNRTELYLVGQEVTVDDSKARRDIGYEGRTTFEEGLRTLDVDAILAAANA